MKDFYLPYSTWIVRTTVVSDGKTKTVERNDRGLLFDPEPPSELWTLEMAVRGLATQLKWEPIPSGVRVLLTAEEKGTREVMVRELGTNWAIAAVRTTKQEIEIPVAPGNYLVEVSEIRDGMWEDLWKWHASVPPDKYVTVVANSPSGNDRRETRPRQELILATSNGWWLHCAADGSGIVGHGPADSDAAEFRAGTIDVATVRQELAKVTSDTPPMGYRFEVMYRDNGGQPSAVHTKDSKIVLGVFEKAARKESTSRRGAGFDRLWAEHPPALKQP